MQLIRRFHLQALFCATAVLISALISRPFTSMGISDDGPYILMAQTLANTGHIAYNGWAAGMIVPQLYLAAAFIKLFGFSFTTVRMSTLLIAVVTAFALQRTLVRASISERNATISTLALVLSPLYLMLSVTFMSDITGLFAIVLCLYGCICALQSSSDRAAIAWLCFAVAANAVCGTSRQIAWLGVLVMVPSTLWLLRRRHRLLVAVAGATLAGALFIFACMQWLKYQPYIAQVPLLVSNFPIRQALEELCSLLMDTPFLLLPISVLFLPQIRKCRPIVIAVMSAVLLAYFVHSLQQQAHATALARLAGHNRGLMPLLGRVNKYLDNGASRFVLEPTHGDWVTVEGIYAGNNLAGKAPIFLNKGAQRLLTIVSLGGLMGLIASLLRSRQTQPAVDATSSTLSWKQLAVLLVPFTLAYILLLLSVFATFKYLLDRYLLVLLFVALICVVRYYQESIRPDLPLAAVFLVAVTSIYGITVTHNMFSFYRARVALAAALRTNGIPDTSVDNGWEYNVEVELQHANHLNNHLIAVPAGAYVPRPLLPDGICKMVSYDFTPHIHPLYGISFDPDACYGPAPFAPIHYSR